MHDHHEWRFDAQELVRYPPIASVQKMLTLVRGRARQQLQSTICEGVVTAIKWRYTTHETPHRVLLLHLDIVLSCGCQWHGVLVKRRIIHKLHPHRRREHLLGSKNWT